MPGTIASVSWEELVTTALLGTDRRPAGADGGPAGLLDSAALHTVRRRAGLLPAAPAARPDPAPADPGPRCPRPPGTDSPSCWRTGRHRAARAAGAVRPPISRS